MSRALRHGTLGMLLLVGALAARPLRAQRLGFPPEEFAARRTALMDRLKDGAVILFGDAAAPAGSHFRQDNDFYYFTGNEDVGAILVMVPAAHASYLFLPPQTAREKTMEGANILDDPQAKAKSGFTDVFPSHFLDEFLARSLGRFAGRFHLRLSPRDTLDDARSETGLFDGRRARSHYNDQLSADLYRIQKLRERYPQMEFKDVTPAVDEMRVLKTPAEIEALRRNGRLSAEAVKQAMLAGRPGVYEYEIEAAAMAVILKGGATGAADAPNVGARPHTTNQQYDNNTAGSSRARSCSWISGPTSITWPWISPGPGRPRAASRTTNGRLIVPCSRSRRPASRPTSPA